KLYDFAVYIQFFFSSRRRHTSFSRDWSSDVCSSDLGRARWRFLKVHEESKSHGFPCLTKNWTFRACSGSCGVGDRDPEGDIWKRSEERRVGKESISWMSAYA